MKNTAFAVTLIICVVFSLLAVESQTIVLVRGNAFFHIGDVEIVAPEKTYYSSTITLSYYATFLTELEHKWIVYSLDGGENVTVYDEYNKPLNLISGLASYNGSVTLSGLSSGSHVIEICSKKGSYVFGTGISGDWFDIADRVYFTIDLSGESSNPTPTIAPTSKPIATPEPTVTPYTTLQLAEQEAILGIAVTMAVVSVGLGLLLYGIKRKQSQP